MTLGGYHFGQFESMVFLGVNNLRDLNATMRMNSSLSLKTLGMSSTLVIIKISVNKSYSS